jgi:hypothetical protein
MLVVLNMARSPQKVSLDLSAQGLGANRARTVLTDGNSPGEVSTKEIAMAPLSVYIGKLVP